MGTQQASNLPGKSLSPAPSFASVGLFCILETQSKMGAGENQYSRLETKFEFRPHNFLASFQFFKVFLTPSSVVTKTFSRRVVYEAQTYFCTRVFTPPGQQYTLRTRPFCTQTKCRFMTFNIPYVFMGRQLGRNEITVIISDHSFPNPRGSHYACWFFNVR